MGINLVPVRVAKVTYGLGNLGNNPCMNPVLTKSVVNRMFKSI